MTMIAAPQETGAPPSALPLHHSQVGTRALEGRGGRQTVVSPADGKAFAEVSLLDREQVGSALQAARGALPGWAGLTFEERGRHLLRLRDAILDDASALADLSNSFRRRRFSLATVTRCAANDSVRCCGGRLCGAAARIDNRAIAAQTAPSAARCQRSRNKISAKEGQGSSADDASRVPALA